MLRALSRSPDVVSLPLPSSAASPCRSQIHPTSKRSKPFRVLRTLLCQHLHRSGSMWRNSITTSSSKFGVF
ncbi:hypothetical protein DsansV1_C24g0181011 [Dioscorea sansibarensis]